MSREGFDYASHYCEENVARLLDRREISGARSVVFISNAARACPLWAQRSAERPDDPVVWDYHVVLLAEGPRAEIWDLDSTLPFPTTALDYLGATFPLHGFIPDESEPRFRVVAEARFREAFASDRSHMRNLDGSYQVPPPPWPPFRTATEAMTLPRFWDMKTPGLGEVYDLAGLRARITSVR